MRKTSIILILFSILISCQEKEQLTLPDSEYYNMEIFPSTNLLKRIDVLQINKDSVQVAYADTQIFAIDSNLHVNIFKSAKIDIPHDYSKMRIATISFDKKTKYETILLIKNELRKLGIYHISLLTSENKGIHFFLPPLSENERRHPFVSENQLFPPAPPSFEKDTTILTLTITHDNGQIQITNSDYEPVELKKMLTEVEDLILHINLTENNTYQDYVNILGTILKTYRSARAKEVVENGLTERQAIKKYRIQMR